MAMAKFLGADYPSDDTSWCGLAMGYWTTKAGGQPPKNYLAARQWLKSGTAVTEPQVGDVCILWRGTPDGWEGHVGLFVSRRGSMLYLLGGNQGNVVTVSSFHADKLLGFRRY